jgi:molybdate transport system substrate-binding protein
MKRFWLAAWLLVMGGPGTQLAVAEPGLPPLTVYGASSLTNALDELGSSYTQSSGQPVKFSYAASSTLARQIEAGAGADIFFSADTDWMDYLQTRKLINTATRRNVLGNKLVLIAPVDSSVQLKIVPGFGLLAALGGGRLSTGDPDSVPIGKYARSALLSLGVWNDVVDRLVRADNVRTALAFVDRGEAPLGIVYETDALVDRKVRVVDQFPADTHPPIVYPIAMTTTAAKGAENFIAYVRGPAGQAIFRKYGFSVLN